MKIHDIGKTSYNLNLTKVSEHLQAWYQANKHLSDNVTLENGKRIDFSRKSLTRIALKTALVPIAIPTLQMFYKMKGAELPPHEKHEDLIDYLVMKMFGMIALFDKDQIYVETLESDQSDERLVHAISTAPPRTALLTAGYGGTEATEEDERPGGETYLRGREDWNGQDETNQGSDT